MKKIIALLLIVVLVSTVGCQIAKKSAPAKEEETTSESDVSQIEKEIAEIDDLEDDIDFEDLDKLEEDLELI